MANENTPLLNHGVFSVFGDGDKTPRRTSRGALTDGNGTSPQATPRKLNTFFGVMVPTILSMFSIVLFLRTGK